MIGYSFFYGNNLVVWNKWYIVLLENEGENYLIFVFNLF